MASAPAGLGARIDEALAANRLGHLAPIMEMVRDRGIGLLRFRPGDSLAWGLNIAGSRSWVCVVGDDEATSGGPRAFDETSLIQAAQCATHACVYSGPADPRCYAMFAAAAALGGRVLLIETQIRHHAEWSRFVRRFAPEAAYLDVTPMGGRA